MNFIRKNLTKLLQNPIYNLNLQNTSHRFVAYKSSISLENLYPGSSLKLTTPQKPPNDGEKFSGYIPMDQVEITYSKSSGPGGQNVNKVNTKVDLRFHLESANWLDDDIKKKLATNLKTKISNEGFLIFRSDITRSQQLNVADCLEKLRSAVRVACCSEPVQSPETAERLRRRYEKAIAERLLIKRQRTQIKQDRKAPSVHDVL